MADDFDGGGLFLSAQRGDEEYREGIEFDRRDDFADYPEHARRGSIVFEVDHDGSTKLAFFTRRLQAHRHLCLFTGRNVRGHFGHDQGRSELNVFDFQHLRAIVCEFECMLKFVCKPESAEVKCLAPSGRSLRPSLGREGRSKQQ